MKPKICARFLCKNEVVLPRRKYCSDNCAHRQWINTYRAAHREETQAKGRIYVETHPEQRRQSKIKANTKRYLSGKIPKWMYR